MSALSRNSCLAAGLALAALAAGNAHAGKPMNVLQKKAAAEAMARQHQAQQGVKAKSTRTVLAKNGPIAEVPDDLHNYLHAEVDAKGNVRILETDGLAAPAKQEANDE